MLSIVVPVYNVEKYLYQCLDSILAQKFSDFELILVDDGSSDSSGQICDKYAEKDSRIRVLHKENEGAQSAVKEGVKLSVGDYITFVDSDDWIEPKMYFEMMALIDKYKADCVMCNYKYYFESTGKYTSVDFGLEEGLYDEANIDKFYDKLLPRFADRRYIAGTRWNKIFVRNKIMESLNNAPLDIVMAEDTLVTHKALLECAKIYYINQDFYIYRRISGSITMSSYKESYLGDWKKATDIYNSYAGADRIFEAKFIHLVNNVIFKIEGSDVSIRKKKLWLKMVARDKDVIEVLRCVDSKDMDKIDLKYYKLLKHPYKITPYLIYRAFRTRCANILGRLGVLKDKRA